MFRKTATATAAEKRLKSLLFQIKYCCNNVKRSALTAIRLINFLYLGKCKNIEIKFETLLFCFSFKCFLRSTLTSAVIKTFSLNIFVVNMQQKLEYFRMQLSENFICHSRCEPSVYWKVQKYKTWHIALPGNYVKQAAGHLADRQANTAAPCLVQQVTNDVVNSENNKNVCTRKQQAIFVLGTSISCSIL